MSLPAGTRLGPYEIVAPLGAGGWAATCQISTIAAKIRSDSSAARKPSEERSGAIAPQVFLMAKLSTYAAGLVGSKGLPITTIVFFDGSGGV